MIQLKIVSVRRVEKPSVYQFFNSDLGIKEYIRKNFQDTGKLVSISSSVSEDFTTETKILVFKSQEDYTSFENNEVLQYQNKLQDRYNNYHRITSTKSISEI